MHKHWVFYSKILTKWLGAETMQYAVARLGLTYGIADIAWSDVQNYIV